MNIKDFKENDNIEQPLFVKSVTSGIANNGKKYFNVLLSDQSGEINAKFWEGDNIEFPSKCIVNIKGVVNKFRDQLQMKIISFEKIEYDGDLSLFVKSSEFSSQYLESKFIAYIDSIKNEILKTILKKVYQNFKGKLLSYPAAVKNHHNFLRGLAHHTISMCEIGDFLASKYAILNRDLLLSGIICHDIGKTIELSSELAPEYTTQGNLLGHISIMCCEIDFIARSLNLEKSDEVLYLKHLILAHHGKLEFGSPVTPKLPEAEILHYIDNIDARMMAIEQNLDSLEYDEFSPKIFALENRSFLKTKFYKGE